MELVYLWVEEYKNIHRQGFNFSPRFRCEFDGETLTIDDNIDEKGNKQYIDNFFGDYINVTAIVGKNGSGKSNLLETLICIIEKHEIPWDNYKICAVFYNEEKDIFSEKNINFYLKIKYKNQAILEDILEGKKNKYKTFLFHYNYTLDYIDNEENNIDFNKLYHKKDNYNVPVLLQPNKANRKIDNWLMDYLANKDILNFVITKDVSIKNIEKFFIPTVCKLDFYFSNIYKNNTYRRILKEKYKEEDINYMTDISKLAKDDLIYLTRVYIIRKSRERNFDSIKDDNFKKLLGTKNNVDANNLIEYIQDKSFEDLYDTSITHKIKKIQDSFLFIDYIALQNKDYKINNKITISDERKLLLNLAPWIDIEFFNEKNISFNSLSYGQKFIIKFLYSILYQLNNLNSYDNYTDIIILLDEVELGLHPQWQKEYLSLLISILQLYSIRFRFNIMCSSHSPFIISDLPKENIIFLKDGVQDKGIKDKQTFGANIHTLLSDSFFMKDGLMGKFAKSKINEIIEFFDEKNKLYSENKEKLYQIINAIGEPFLKEKLLFMYNERFPKTKEEQIAEYKAEIERLEADDKD